MRALGMVAAFALASACVSSLGQGSYREKDWQEICQQAAHGPLAAPDLDGPLPASKLASCNGQELYYGFHGKPDYAAALQCAWYERDHPNPGEANMFYGPGVLTMLYANGQGVPRNYDMAIRFACEQDWASNAEMELRVGHLEALRDGRAERSHFDLCDDITSGVSMGACTAIQTSRADAKREQEIRAITAEFPDSARVAFERLRKAEAAFEEARSGSEIDLSGTARGMFELEERKRLGDRFLANLQRLGSGDLPKVTDSELAQLGRALNSVYEDIQHAPAQAWHYGTIKPEGIRETERTWVALEDAWVEFAKQAYPKVDPNAVRAQIIGQRLRQLRSLAPKE